MFKFTDLSDNDEFKAEDYRLNPKEFFEKRRTSRRPYVFDLRSANDYELSHLPGSHNLPIEHFENSIYQMPFSGDILLYGGENGEVLTAAEILYDNGFDTFYYVDSYLSLFNQIDESYVIIRDEAREKIQSQLNANPELWGVEMNVEVKSPLKGIYSLDLIQVPEKGEGFIHLEKDGIRIRISSQSIPFLEGTELIINEEEELEARNPQMSITKLTGSIEDQVQQLLVDQVNPMVAAHGGVVSIHAIEKTDVYLQFGGGCQGCGQIDVTLKQGIEVMLKESIPEISNVYDATDHAGGTNPYFQ